MSLANNDLEYIFANNISLFKILLSCQTWWNEQYIGMETLWIHEISLSVETSVEAWNK